MQKRGENKFPHGSSSGRKEWREREEEKKKKVENWLFLFLFFVWAKGPLLKVVMLTKVAVNK